MNHKRGRPKNRRSGCLMCKPWKVNGAKHKCTHAVTRDQTAAREDVASFMQSLGAKESKILRQNLWSLYV